MKTLRLLMIALVVALIASACGTAPTPAPTPTEDPLPLSFSSTTGAITFNVPHSWVMEDQSVAIAIANNDAAMREVLNRSSLDSGEVGGQITAFSADTAAAMTGAPQTAAQLISLIASNITIGSPSDPTEVTLNGRNAAYVTLLLSNGDSIGIAVEVGGGAFVLLQANTARGELAQHQETLLAIAGTINFNPQDASISSATAEATP